MVQIAEESNIAPTFKIGDGDIDFDQIMPLFSDYKGTWVPKSGGVTCMADRDFAWPWSGLKNIFCSRIPIQSAQ